MFAQISLAGMVQYSPTNPDTNLPTLFDLLELPSPPLDAAAIGLEAQQLRAAWTIDKGDLIAFLCLKTNGMTLAYPDMDFMRNAIGTWSRIHIHEWQRIFDTLFYKYNALWNKDGAITESGWDHIHDDADGWQPDRTKAANTTTNFVHGYDNPTSAGGSSSQEDNAGDDPDPDPVPYDDGRNWTHSDKLEGRADTVDRSSFDTNNTRQSSYNHGTTEKGNIGVTKSTELIEDERKSAMFSFDEYFAHEFMKMFCLQIW